jgi:HAD superfamily hydrolase (TIGR01490 family)
MTVHNGRAAFFDVDGTLTTSTTIFDFLEYDLARRCRPAADFRRAMDELSGLRMNGAARTEVNRAFYRNFAGRDEHELARAGRDWFEQNRRGGKLFHPRTLARLRRHRHDGDFVALVSGSFPPCLDPIAEFTGTHVVLCSRPEIRDGHYTGALAEPMIGGRKADAVRAVAAARGIDLARSRAYADDASDLPMLRLVGRPEVVGDDPVLREYTLRHGAVLAKLSDRELEVLRLIADGRSNLAICHELRLRPKTVEAHVRSLFAKLGLENRRDEHRRVMAAVTYFRHAVPAAPNPVTEEAS